MSIDMLDCEIVNEVNRRKFSEFLKSDRAKDFALFALQVMDHVERYTVPQYGDKGKDKATNYSPKRCIEEIEKYCARFGKNVRPGQELLDLMKIAHYAAITYMKLKEGANVETSETGVR